MSDYLDRLERELRAAIERDAERRPLAPRRRRAPWTRVLAPALAGAAAVALVVAVAPDGDRSDERESSPPPRSAVPLELQGTYDRVGEPGRGMRLWLQDDSATLIVPGDAVPSQLLGFVSVSADRFTVRVDRERAGGAEWPDAGCAGATREARGVYRYSLRSGVLRFRVVDDPCRGRVRLFTARAWRRGQG